MLSILITMVTLMNTFDVSISNEMVCTKDHITEALKSASHCRPLPKVVKLEMPGNGSFTQVRSIRTCNKSSNIEENQMIMISIQIILEIN